MIKKFLTWLKIAPAVVPTTEPLNSHVSRNLTKGSSYLVKELKAEFSFELFVSLVKGRCNDCDYLDSFPCESIGCERCKLPCTCKVCKHSRAQGLCFTMHSPQDIRLKYALQTTPIFWISNHGPQSINPIALEVIADIIINFLKQSKNPVILLDGIEHLIFENGSAPVLRLLRDIQEWIILQRAILILPVDPAAIEKKELALMERNMFELRQNANDD
ncbi:MAG: DUF835 domain-containing protein [Methanothrix sp.]|nr:DUF835 domain-containing protein [Methanothrix sp.]